MKGVTSRAETADLSRTRAFTSVLLGFLLLNIEVFFSTVYCGPSIMICEWNLFFDICFLNQHMLTNTYCCFPTYTSIKLLHAISHGKRFLEQVAILIFSFLGVNVTGDDFVSKGQTILLTCNATGEDHAPDTVDWFINGLKVDKKNMPRVRVYNKVDIYRRTLLSTLEIRRSLMSDTGVYICRGPDEKTSKLTVHILDGKLV